MVTYWNFTVTPLEFYGHAIGILRSRHWNFTVTLREFVGHVKIIKPLKIRHFSPPVIKESNQENNQYLIKQSIKGGRLPATGNFFVTFRDSGKRKRI